MSSELELAPLKKEAPVPVGIKVNQIQHSEYGGADKSDSEMGTIAPPKLATESDEYSAAEEADKVEDTAPKDAIPN